MSDVFILTTIYLVLIFGLIAVWRTAKSFLRTSEYREALTKVKDYEFARHELVGNERLPLFREFDHHLVTVPALDGSGDEELRRSVDASEIFSEDELGARLASNRLFQALPGIVTGIGVLGTFIGLQLGIGGLNLQDLKQLEKNIVPLIKGCAVAFSTSVWGVLMSMIFSALEKLLDSFALSGVSQLQSKVDQLVPRYVPEEAMAGLERSSRGTEGLLKGLAVAIGDEMQKAIGRLGAEIKDAVSNATKEGQGPLVEQSANLLSSALTAELGKLKDSVDGMGQRLTESVSSASDTLVRSVGSFEPTVSALSEVVSNTQETVHTAVDKLSAHESVMEQMGQAAEHIFHAASSFHSMREAIETSSSLNREASQAQQATAAISQEVISKFASVGESLQKMQPIADSLVESVTSSQTAISSAVNKLTAHEVVMGEMGKAADKLHAAATSFETMSETLEETSSKNREAALAQKEAATKNQEVVEKFDHIGEGLQGFGPTVSGLAESVAGMKSLVTQSVDKLNAHGDVMTQMSGAVDKLQLASESFASMNTALELASSQNKEAAVAQQSAANLNQEVAQKFATVGEHLPQAQSAIVDAARVIGSLGAPLMELQSMMAKQPELQQQLEGQRAASEEERSTRLLSMSTELAKTVETAVLEFSKVGAMAEQLGAVITRLEGASAELARFGQHVVQASKDQKDASEASRAAASSNERVAKTLEPLPSGIVQLTNGLGLAGDKLREGAEATANSYLRVIEHQKLWQQGVETGLMSLRDRVQEVMHSYGGQIEGQTQTLMNQWTEEVTRCLKSYETQVETLEGSLEDLRQAINKFNPRH